MNVRLVFKSGKETIVAVSDAKVFAKTLCDSAKSGERSNNAWHVEDNAGMIINVSELAFVVPVDLEQEPQKKALPKPPSPDQKPSFTRI